MLIAHEPHARPNAKFAVRPGQILVALGLDQHWVAQKNRL
jgi:hypothetical protein